jgi:hypothetical protein
MHANQTYPHYSPSWVGGLMDPVFLRHAVNDAEGESHAEDLSSPSRWVNLQAAIGRVAAFFLRRSNKL